MIFFGSPAGWVDFIDSQIPDILELVIETWESLESPAGNALEDPVSLALCRALQQSPKRCDLPFHIHPQLVELDPNADEEQGRMDIVFSLLVPSEDIYFCLECKRLNVRGEASVRPLYAEYIRHGMMRFVRGQYAGSVRNGGMLGFVLDGNTENAIAGVQRNIRSMAGDLGMGNHAALARSAIRPEDPRVRETAHQRENPLDPFVIHHLFMAGDPNAPLLPRRPKVEKKKK